ncbi:interleukin-1 beta-like isoform X2 [Conger conger]|nr:interleukin-1 beta-like isoform X2 [Conger conger]
MGLCVSLRENEAHCHAQSETTATMGLCVSLRENEAHCHEDECDDLTRITSIMERIMNKNQQFLVMKPNGSLKFQYMIGPSDNGRFLFQMYCNNYEGTPLGHAITLQVDLNNQKYVLCCSGEGMEKNICAKQQDAPLPHIIEDSRHEAVFFLQKLRPAGKFKIESAKWPNWYLSFKGASEPKLVLSEVTDGVVNENIEFRIRPP